MTQPEANGKFSLQNLTGKRIQDIQGRAEWTETCDGVPGAWHFCVEHLLFEDGTAFDFRAGFYDQTSLDTFGSRDLESPIRSSVDPMFSQEELILMESQQLKEEF